MSRGWVETTKKPSIARFSLQTLLTRGLGWCAVGMFVVSLFLPAVSNRGVHIDRGYMAFALVVFAFGGDPSSLVSVFHNIALVVAIVLTIKPSLETRHSRIIGCWLGLSTALVALLLELDGYTKLSGCRMWLAASFLLAVCLISRSFLNEVNGQAATPK
ncbi:MAG: hypothetical protein AAGJ46_20055 [Planctomycetota bacterium]